MRYLAPVPLGLVGFPRNCESLFGFMSNYVIFSQYSYCFKSEMKSAVIQELPYHQLSPAY